MSNLVDHARRELELAGLFSPDSSYGGMLGPAIMKMVEVFAAEGHSGFSAGMARSIFARVAAFKPLSPITADPDEWMDVAERAPGEKGACWQNKRNPSLFSEDGGKTYRDLDHRERGTGDATHHAAKEADKGSISDGYHTFDELYDHRITLFIAMCSLMHQVDTSLVARLSRSGPRTWKSKLHGDGEPAPVGWFVAGIYRAPGEQITYHIPIARWHECWFMTELNQAPDFDGHTPADVITRLKNLTVRNTFKDTSR